MPNSLLFPPPTATRRICQRQHTQTSASAFLLIHLTGKSFNVSLQCIDCLWLEAIHAVFPGGRSVRDDLAHWIKVKDSEVM